MNETAYWITLAHLPQWGYRKINELIVKFSHENKISVVDFFELTPAEWKEHYQLTDSDISDLTTAKKELPNSAFLAETLINQGFEIIPITQAAYSGTMKANLKMSYSPPLLYTKGDKSLLNESSVAIVGSRNASEKALLFTNHIAQKAKEAQQVVVSGFAKGVDKQALDATLACDGKSIIVLPQGIMTFDTGFRTYYKHIIGGKVLVLSTFYPKWGWTAGLAMARNPIIYGLAKDIYVAESASKGGTWTGVIDGLRKGRKIFVRQPDTDEPLNANTALIERGATPVDFFGNVITLPPKNTAENAVDSDSSADEKLMQLLQQRPLSAKEITEKLQLPISVQKLTNLLKKKPYIRVFKEQGGNLYGLNNQAKTTTTTLF